MSRFKTYIYIYIYIWCNKNQIFDIMKYFVERGCNYNVLCWCKTNPVPFGASAFLSDIEYCLVFYEDTKKFKNGIEHKRKWICTSINVDDKRKFGHPTIKPIEFVKKNIENITDEGDVVLDTFLGSGTTCKACQEIGRRYIGFEIDEHYFKIAQDRLNNTEKSGQMFLF